MLLGLVLPVGKVALRAAALEMTEHERTLLSISADTMEVILTGKADGNENRCQTLDEID